MFSHGLVTGALFLCVGIVYDRTHTRLFADLGGFAKRMPVYALLLGFFSLASLGLPMMSGFVGEFMVLLAAFGWSYVAGVLSLLGVVLAAAYMLWMYKRVVFGELRSEPFARIPDANRVEVMALLPLAVLVMWVGISPGTFVNLLNTATAAIATYR